MNRVNNSNILKSYKGCIRIFIIGVLVFFLSFVLFYLGSGQDSKDTDNIKYLNELIESREEKTGKKSYLTVSYLTDKIVVYDDTTNAYYFAFDGKYYYMVYLKEADAKRMLNKDLSKNPEKIIGSSKNIPSDVKKIAIEVYNDYFLNDGDEKLTISTFYNVFGDVYLDTTDTFSSTASMYMIFGFISFISGIILSLIGITFTIRFKKNIKSLSDDDLLKIEREMEDNNAFYYEKKKLYLTENYLIMLDGRFNVYNYKDIVWMYPFEQRYNGIRTNKAIKISTNDGKTNIIANTSIATKQQKAIYDEIWNTIAQKNPSMKIGYIPDNISYFKDLVKEIKLSKKR